MDKLLNTDQIQTKNTELESSLKELRKVKLENETLSFKTESQENKIQILEKELENYQITNKDMERKYKEDLLNYRNKLENKESELQTLMNKTKEYKFELEKQKQVIKLITDTKTSDQVLIEQIENMQAKFAEREVNIIHNYIL